jgi:hypothetical protein
MALIGSTRRNPRPLTERNQVAAVCRDSWPPKLTSTATALRAELAIWLSRHHVGAGQYLAQAPL